MAETPMDVETCLRVLFGFKDRLEGHLSLSDRVQMAAEVARIESFLARKAVVAPIAQDAKAASDAVAKFMQVLPDITPMNFKVRRAAKLHLSDAIKHVARIIAFANAANRRKEEARSPE